MDEAAPSAAHKWVGLLLKGLGALLSMFAFPGCLFSIHALIDPLEAQLSNDADPFGAPPTTGESSLQLIVWLVILCTGLWLFFAAGPGNCGLNSSFKPIIFQARCRVSLDFHSRCASAAMHRSNTGYRASCMADLPKMNRRT